jgi:hypothetical protein
MPKSRRRLQLCRVAEILLLCQRSSAWLLPIKLSSGACAPIQLITRRRRRRRRRQRRRRRHRLGLPAGERARHHDDEPACMCHVSACMCRGSVCRLYVPRVCSDDGDGGGRMKISLRSVRHQNAFFPLSSFLFPLSSALPPLPFRWTKREPRSLVSRDCLSESVSCGGGCRFAGRNEPRPFAKTGSGPQTYPADGQKN